MEHHALNVLQHVDLNAITQDKTLVINQLLSALSFPNRDNVWKAVKKERIRL
jgi:hypothetical protein